MHTSIKLRFSNECLFLDLCLLFLYVSLGAVLTKITEKLWMEGSSSRVPLSVHHPHDSTRYNNDPTYTTRWRFDLVKLISKYLRRLLENNRLRVTHKETRVRGTESFRRLIQKVSESSRHLSTRWTPRTSRNPQVSHPSHPLAEL